MHTILPTRWRAGVMAAVPRKPGLPLSLANGRGVLCSSHVGKLAAKACRAQLIGALKQAAGPLQFGAVPGGGVEAPGHAVRMFLALAAAAKWSAAALFTDLRSAFYTALKEAALGPLGPSESWADRLRTLGLDDVMIEYVRVLVEERSDIFTEYGADAAWLRFARDWHVGSHFRVQNGDEWVVPDDGTRPGDPLADLVFATAFLRFQELLIARLGEAGLAVELELDAATIFAPGGPNTTVEASPPTYMDDMAVLLRAPCAALLVETVVRAMVIVQGVATQFGLVLNLGAGKTEGILRFCGAGSAEARRACFGKSDPSDGSIGLLDLPCGATLRVVQRYKHLGVMAGASLSMGAEITARVASAHGATAALTPKILVCDRLPAAARTLVAGACSNSRLLFSAGAWGDLPAYHMERVNEAHMRPLRRILLAHRPPAAGEAWRTNAEVRSALKIPAVSALVSAARLRYAARASRHSPPFVLALLRSAGGAEWRQAVVRDTALLWLTIPGKVGSLPDPRIDMMPWEAFWRTWPVQWAALVALMVQAAAKQPVEFEKKLVSLGVRATDGREPVAECDGWVCNIDGCLREFSTTVGLAAHRTRAHGYTAPERNLVASSLCPVCGTDFRSRKRARLHLRYGALGCRLAMEEGRIPEVEECLIAEADAAQAAAGRAFRRTGAVLGAGLPSLPPAAAAEEEGA